MNQHDNAAVLRRTWPAPAPVFTAVMAAAVLVLTACGSPAKNTTRTADGATRQVTVGVIPIVDVAPLYLGQRKGFFSERGITLRLESGQGGAAIVPGVMSGHLQFGFSNITSLLIARDKGLDVRMVANGDSSTGEAGRDFGAVVVPEDSPVRSARDLPGRSVAVNTLQNIGDSTIRASVRKAGGDPDAVRFTELAFPDMPAALQKERVDAAWVIEPFLSIAQEQGARVVAWNFVDTAPDLTIAAYFTSGTVARDDPDLVERFRAAMNESLEYAQTHEDEVRQAITTYTKLTEQQVAGLTLPEWPTEINRASVQTLADLAVRDGLVSGDVDLAALLP